MKKLGVEKIRSRIFLLRNFFDSPVFILFHPSEVFCPRKHEYYVHRWTKTANHGAFRLQQGQTSAYAYFISSEDTVIELSTIFRKGDKLTVTNFKNFGDMSPEQTGGEPFYHPIRESFSLFS